MSAEPAFDTNSPPEPQPESQPEPGPDEVLLRGRRRLNELEARLPATTDLDERCWLSVQLAEELVDHYEYGAAFEEELGEPDPAELSAVLVCAEIVLGGRPGGAAAEAIRLPLGMAHLYLFWLTDERAHLDVALEHLPAVVDTIQDPEERVRRWSAVSRLLLARYQLGSTTAEADLNRAIQLLGLVLSSPDVADLHVDSAVWRGLALAEVCDHTVGSDRELPALLSMALRALDSARQQTDQPDIAAELAGRMGELLYRRDALGLPPADGTDLERAIDLLLRSVTTLGSRTADPTDPIAAATEEVSDSSVALCLGRCFDARYERHQRPADRAAAIAWFDQAATRPDLSADDIAECQERSGLRRLERFETDADPLDLELSIRDLTAARDALPPGDDTRVLALFALAEAVMYRAGDRPAPSDVAEQVACIRELTEQVRPDHPGRLVLLVRLAYALGQQLVGRQQWLPELDGLLTTLTEQELSLPAAEVELRTPITILLGQFYTLRFLVLAMAGAGDPQDGDRAIEWLRRGFDCPGADDEFRLGLHRQSGMVHWLRNILLNGWHPHLNIREWQQRYPRPEGVTSFDLHQAREHFERAAALDPTAPEPFQLAFIRCQLLLGDDADDTDVDDATIESLIRQLASIPRFELGTFWPMASSLRVGLAIVLATRSERIDAADRAVESCRATLAEIPSVSPFRALVQHSLGRALALRARLCGSADDIVEAVHCLSATVEVAAALGQQLPELAENLAEAQALAWSLSVVDLASRPTEVEFAPTLAGAARLIELADALHGRGEAGRAIEVGTQALRDYAQLVLLSDQPDTGLAAARIGNQHAERFVHWALRAGDVPTAITLLEAGRGLVLHAATLSVGVPDLLRRSGHQQQAELWESGGGSAEVRASALVALHSPAGMQLQLPMTADTIGPVLWAAELDTLVYLVAGDDGPGAALLVRDDGETTQLSLPGLRITAGGPLARCRAAHRAAFLTPTGEEQHSDAMLSDQPQTGSEVAIQRWRADLELLSEWAHEVAIGPLLAEIRGWGRARLPRLGLVPTGSLTMVPWHAARSRPAGIVRYACQDAVFSYAASARQLADAVRRPRLPIAETPVFVANPTRTQIWPPISAAAARDAFYPGATYLGYPARQSGGCPGTPAEVLSWLPSASQDGASMLQLSTHAMVQDSSTRSHFELAGGQRLSVAEVLDRAGGRRPEAPGGLVICDSCMTDLTEDDHDEVLTLGTAFLAAGAVSVIGARWPLDDRLAAILTFVLHQRLALGLRPAEALRQAQLWMLDPNRPIPAELPALLAAEAGRPELANLDAWAALVHQGQ